MRHRVVIPNGESLSAAVDLTEMRVVAIDLPSAWTAAAITFTAAAEGEDDNDGTTPTYDQVNDSGGNEISLTVAASRYIVLTTAHKDALRGLYRCKVRSGTAGAAVNQAAARELILVCEVR